MKKITILVTLCLLYLIGCTKSNNSVDNISNLSAEDVLNHIIIPMEISNITPNGKGLLFNSTDQISTDQLLNFFIYSLGDLSDSSIMDLYYDSKTENLIIPISEVEGQLDKYFSDYTLDTSYNDSNYTFVDDDISFSNYSGFGGERYAKIDTYSIQDDLVILTVNFFDENYENIYLTKTYTFKPYSDGYFIIKIIEQ